MVDLSSDYYRALAEATEHHASSKTYSGKFLRPHAPFIKEIIDRLECRSVLDYGCGKGAQYAWVSHGDDASIPEGMTIEQYWGVPVTKFDPAYPPFAKDPEGNFDLVICTHTLGAIPRADLPSIIERLYLLANKAVYIAEKIGPVKKKVYSQEILRPLGYKRHDWEALLTSVPIPSHLEVTLATRERTDNGVIVTRGVL